MHDSSRYSEMKLSKMCLCSSCKTYSYKVNLSTGLMCIVHFNSCKFFRKMAGV